MGWLGIGVLSMSIQQTVYEDIQSSNDRRSSKMYSVYHEMDIMKFVEAINEKWDQYYTETNLKRLRKIAGLSQRTCRFVRCCTETDSII